MKNPVARMYTEKGVITIELYPDAAPNTVKSFIWSSQRGFYRNRLIKRVVKGFVLQPSYNHFEDENCNFMLEGEFSANGFDNPLKFEKYVVAMAGDGEKESHGCEFFITLSDSAAEKLQGKFTPFGRVIDGFSEVDRLADVPVRNIAIEGVSAIIKQPLNDEYMLDITVDTFEESYTQPNVKYWIKGE